jgi:hypothetical protein
MAGAYAVDPEQNENLALRARVTADSEYSRDYRAAFVADGKIPGRLSREDLGRAWCVNGGTHRQGAALTFAWFDRDTPLSVTVAEIVYFGRTAWHLEECWRDVEVTLEGEAQPVLRGRLECRHGPQRLILPRPMRCRRLTLRFSSSYGGPNPGAAEIQVYSQKLSAGAFEALERKARSPLTDMPWVDRVDSPSLCNLIRHLHVEHGEGYAQFERHQSRLTDRTAWRPSREEALARLQRDVLLFDVDKLLVIKRHEIQASHVYTYHYEGFRAGGGLYLFDARNPEQEPRELVTSPTGQILDCDLSYDGGTILFSWRRTEDEGYHLWTIEVDGSGLRQLTEGPWHDYNACWLPDGGIAFLSSRAPQFAYCWHAPVGVVYRMDADGHHVRKLSANYLNDFTPAVLNDGRIIYSRWEYVDKPAIPIQSLWTLNPDGSNLSMYFGNGVLSPGTFMEPRSIPGSDRILCTMTGHNGPTRGAIGVIDRTRGVNAQAAIRNITPDVSLPPVNQGNGNTPEPKPYSCPFPLDSRRFLVSARGPILVRTLDGECQSLVLAAPDNGMQYFSAQPVRVRSRPPALASVLPSASSSTSAATIYLQDVYRGLEPTIRRGQIKRLRVVQELAKNVRIDPQLRAFGFQFPVISCGATYAGKRVLGEVPVEPDGSAYFHVPAGIPIYFMVLDGQGRALQRMRSFTHLMPGEVQGCVGCHESRHSVPPTHSTLAMARGPRTLETPEWGNRGFDYVRIVQPVLDAHCIDCHHPGDAPNRLDFTGDVTDFFNVSYDCLAREGQGQRGSPYISWIPTYNGQEQNILDVEPLSWGSPASRLADIILSGHPDAEGHARVQLNDRERRRILAWIDLNVPYYGSSETAYPDNIGCRQIYPADLDRVLADVRTRRCSACHAEGQIPRRPWTRITQPQFNNFLRAPLAKAAGGSEACGQAVFADKNDRDYQAILACFASVHQMLQDRPRIDMPGGQPALSVNRECK